MAQRKTTTKSLRILRAVLLVSLVAFVAIVFALYRFGKAGLPEQAPVAEDSGVEAEGATVMAGEGFDYLIAQGEQPIARIRADRILSQQEEEVVLEGLNPIEVYREDGDLYRIFSDSGTYNFDTQDTTLEGNVRIEGPRGLRLEAGGMSMGRRAQIVTSETSVLFSMAGEFSGRARSLTVNLKREIFTLSGRVQVRSVSPLREPILLNCRRLTYHRRSGVLQTEGDVRFSRGESQLQAPEMQFHLTEDESSVRFISAKEGVAAHFVKRLGGRIRRTLDLIGDELAVQLDPETGDPLEGEVRSSAPGRTARLWSTDETSLVRSLTAPILHALFTDGEISYAEAYGTVFLREYLAFAPAHNLSWACGERAEVTFGADGEIAEASFHERVDFRTTQGLARAHRVDMSADPERTVMTGDPAHLIGVQGELTAPQIVQHGENGPVEATGGVRGLFDQGRGKRTLAIGGGKGPVRLESVRAAFDPATQRYRFEEKVRMWQGENLLLADRLESAAGSDRVIARGNVKTILVPEEESGAVPGEEAGKAPDPPGADPPQPVEAGAEAAGEGQGPPAEEAEEEGEGLSRDPIEVTAEWMEYDVAARTIVYHDNVRMIQVGRLMVCDEAEAHLLEAGGIETLDCRGNARVDDNVAGRSVSGDDARYEVALGEITFTGRRVVMTGEKGERIEGRSLVYDLATGAARIAGSRGPSPAAPVEPEAEESAGG